MSGRRQTREALAAAEDGRIAAVGEAVDLRVELVVGLLGQFGLFFRRGPDKLRARAERRQQNRERHAPAKNHLHRGAHASPLRRR